MSKKICILVIAGMLGAAAGADAQDLAGVDVTEINFTGLERVSEQLIKSKIESQTGEPYDASAVARDLRRLHGLGYFSTIKVDAAPRNGGLVLTFIFDEKRIVGDLKIIGNKKLRTRRVRAVLTCHEGTSFSSDAFDDERAAIIKLYKEKGFPNASVNINVEKIGPGRARLTYEITEGKRARIRSIKFAGNQALGRRKLKKTMKSRPSWWFFGGRYNEEKFEDDLDNVIDAYGNVGRLEAEIPGTEIAFSPNRKKMDITVNISEGPEYTVGDLEVAHNEVYDDDEITDIIEVHAGDIHNKGQIQEDAELVAKGYQDSGYVNAEVTPQVTLDREKKTTHLVHDVEERDLKYIREIDITGNTVTKDEIIRRQMLVKPGERFDGSALRLSQQRIENTEYFDNVRLTLHDYDDDDLYSRLMLDVEEGKTGNFNFGAGYSTEEKLGGFAELRFNNFDIMNWPTFSGGGQIFSTRIQLGSVRTRFNVSFTDPEIAGYPIAFGFDVFDESYNYDTSGVANYTEESRGGQLRLGKSMSPYVMIRTSLRYYDTDYDRWAASWWYNPQLQRDFEGSATISNSWSVERNTLDIRRNPSSGSRHLLSSTLAGLGGDNEFYKLEHDSRWFRPLNKEKKWVLSFRTRQGWAESYGSSAFVPIADRFFAGGTGTVRGYDTRDVGPRVHEFKFLWHEFGSRVPVGGELRLVNNLELKYKINETFRVYTFVDSGGVWEEASDFDLGDVKYSTGIGFGVDIPKMGPIRIDYGFPLNPDEDQGSGRLHMMTGLRF